MSYRRYVRDRLAAGAVLTWTDDRDRQQWVWDYDGDLWGVRGRVPRHGDVVVTSDVRRCGPRKLGWVIDNYYVSVVDADEIPSVVQKCIMSGSDVT